MRYSSLIAMACSFGALVFAAPLSAKEPSSAEIRSAIEAELDAAKRGVEANRQKCDDMQNQIDAMRCLMGAGNSAAQQVKILEVKKLSCAPAGRGGYYCDYRIVTDVPMFGPMAENASRRFIYSEGRWIMLQD